MNKKDYKTLVLDPKYIPKKSEEYMSLEQRAYFYQLLTTQREELISDNEQVLNQVRMADKTDAAGVGDDLDNSAYAQEIDFNLKLSERKNNLLKKIDAALARLEEGTYGYSVMSGDEIGIKRMLASPFAVMTLEEKEESERRK